MSESPRDAQRHWLRGWIAANLTATAVLSVPAAVEEGGFGVLFMVPIVLLPFALVVTLPTLFLRAVMPTDPALWQCVGAGVAVAVVLGGVLGLDLVGLDRVGGWLTLFTAGAAAGAVWSWAEKGAADA